MRDRVLLPLKDSRIYRDTLLPITVDPEGTGIHSFQRKRDVFKRDVEQKALHKVQRNPYIVSVCGCSRNFTEEGMAECMENINYYRENAKIITQRSTENIPFTGGVNSPYIWFQCPNGMESWEFFDYLLNNAEVGGDTGSGDSARMGKYFFRLTAFGQHESTKEAMRRFDELF